MFRSAGPGISFLVVCALTVVLSRRNFRILWQDHASQGNESHSGTGYSHSKNSWRFLKVISTRSSLVANDARRMQDRDCNASMELCG